MAATVNESLLYLLKQCSLAQGMSDTEVQELLRRSIGDPETYHGSESFRKWFRYIQETESVSVHLRGGDYLIGNNKEVYGGICTPRYYHKAVEYIRQSAPEAKFFLFTNDKAYARLQYGRWTSFVIVEDRELSDLDEFILMRSCRHHILANSSFSWWAAWLDSRAQAKVIAPFPWLRKRDIRDIYIPNYESDVDADSEFEENDDSDESDEQED